MVSETTKAELIVSKTAEPVSLRERQTLFDTTRVTLDDEYEHTA